MSDYGIKISEPGFDVETASDRSLVYSSEFDSLKNFLSGTVDLHVPETAGGEVSTDSETITHDRGTVYPFLIFINLDGINTGFSKAPHSTSKTETWGVSDSNSLTLKFQLDNSAGDSSLGPMDCTFRYFMFII